MPYPVQSIKPFINILLCGEPGVGKTTFAAGAQRHPGMRNVLFLNIEGGLLSVAGVQGVEVEDIASVDELEAVFWKLVNKEEGYGHFQTVVIDSGTELQTLDLEQVATTAFTAERAEEKDKKKHKRKSVDNIWLEDYGENSARLKRVFRWFRDAPFNLIVTALAKSDFEKLPRGATREPALLSVRPAFTAKLGMSVEGYMDFVWQLSQQEVTVTEATDTEAAVTEMRRFLLTSQNGPYRAKTRGAKFSLALGQIVEDPDLAKIFDLLLKTELSPEAPKTHAKKEKA